jgi:Glycosyl transferase family 11
MIISQLLGGLGNQMFQYATARALSVARDTELALDISRFGNYTLYHGFELQKVFQGVRQTARIATAKEVRRCMGFAQYSPIQNILAKPTLRGLRPSSWLPEPDFNYWAGLDAAAQARDDCYLTGYWQSEKYFENQADLIRQDFSFLEPCSAANLAIQLRIQQKNAVSIHVRRGDYVNNAATLAVHGVCTLAYYEQAINYLKARVANPHFVVFSDDLEWVRNNLGKLLPDAHEYVSNNQGSASYNDMRLMSACRHHIIANSSFSWWGAWLNPRPDKMVIAPRRWFNRAADTPDLLPSAWLTL